MMNRYAIALVYQADNGQVVTSELRLMIALAHSESEALGLAIIKAKEEPELNGLSLTMHAFQLIEHEA